ncbi:class A beta-lactamase [Caulobacter sp. 17J80-11]|uniref:class A beta-lactamase n=1 Tax=Caulobacter sp. 17J80-11 TaxID=2763502 RepID=UPI0016537F85|nr:class A beta-lactamase [Caulobacter sp. 17J80-11]MBC6981890.1 class A beta-lactamase [Caulobacter sp. 17J80-11]
MIGRRAVLTGFGFGAAALAGCGVRAEGRAAAEPAPPVPDVISPRIAEIEARVGGRLGVAALDLQNGRRFAHRGDERFPMCSTFKFLLASQVLARVDRGEEGLDRRVPVTAADIVSWSPATKERVGADMSVEELCAAAVSQSDNAAANLMLGFSGGPAALTAFARSLGDEVTRLDRTEPGLNMGRPGDPRDTTSPQAMLKSMGAIVLGPTLTEASRTRLTGWMKATTTGQHRLRAGLPSAWTIGDKTGTGERGTANDIAVAWPPSGGPVLITAYLTGAEAVDAKARDQALADVGRVVGETWPKWG